MRSYERYGAKLFLNTLKKQAESFDPNLMLQAYIDFYQDVFVDAAKREFNTIRVMNQKNFIPDGFFLSTWRAWIGEWVRSELGNMIANINQNTLNQIQIALAQGIEQGLNTFETQQLIQEIIAKPSRALAIAKTEATRANNMGKKRSAQDWSNETGTQLWKLWIHGGSRDARESHLMQESRHPIREDMLFPVGDGMDVPGDQRGGAEETINCSCVVQYVSEEYVRRFYPGLV